MSEKSEGNGKTSVLLWLNTLLTALILPLLAFMGSKLWGSVESNATSLQELKLEVSIIKERQNRVLSELPRLDNQDSTIEQQFEEHLRKWHSPP